MVTATKGTSTTTKKVVKKSVKADLDSANKTVNLKKVISHRVLKYKYPKGCKETTLRKSFRQKVRNTIRKMERDIQKLKGADRKNMKEELKAFQSDHLLA